jgi:RNA polymerase sigma factor for flagellar operon FliA
LGRTPTQAELADHMGKDIELFHKERTQARRFETYSMEVVTEEVMNIATDASQQPEAIVEHEQFMGVLTDAIADLPERDQLLMNLYYVEELNLKEIGEVLGVTGSSPLMWPNPRLGRADDARQFPYFSVWHPSTAFCGFFR